MSDVNLARRVEIRLYLDGVDVSADINKYFTSMTYTDNEADKTDDLQVSIDDREGVWLGNWLNVPRQKVETTAEAATSTDTNQWAVGDTVVVNGRPQYSSYGEGSPGALLTNYTGKITKLNQQASVPYPIHIDTKGWFAENNVIKQSQSADTTQTQQSNDIKGMSIQAIIVQKNWYSDGKDKMLDCGVFAIDSIDSDGPPARVNIKATSIPYTSTIRMQKKTKAWENIYLSTIAKEIAENNGMTTVFESSYNPYFTRQEQIQQSDIVFLQGLCKNAGISLKTTSKMIVLFDALEYEKKEPITTIKCGESNVIRYRFATNLNDTSYSSCHVSYTNTAGKTIEYTYTPRIDKKEGPVLEINEKVNNREEARQLAMKRLREKNKDEYTADFTLIGDLDLVAGVTVNISGYGLFDGKYIIDTATHNLTSGYNVGLTLRRVLEEY